MNRKRVRSGLALLCGAAMFAAFSGIGGSCLFAQTPNGLGKRDFGSHCAVCHGLDGRGGEHAPPIANNPAVQALSDDALIAFLRKGMPEAGMPSFAYLGERKLKPLVSYLRALGGGNSLKSLKGNAMQGREIFFGKGACSDCHRIDGRGGFLGGDLSRFALGHTAGEVRQVIEHPNAVLVPRWETVNVTTRSGQSFRGIVRNEDNFSIQLQSLDGVYHLLMKRDLERITREHRSPMPDNYSERLNSDEIDDLISFLFKSAHPAAPQAGTSPASAH